MMGVLLPGYYKGHGRLFIYDTRNQSCFKISKERLAQDQGEVGRDYSFGSFIDTCDGLNSKIASESLNELSHFLEENWIPIYDETSDDHNNLFSKKNYVSKVTLIHHFH